MNKKRLIFLSLVLILSLFLFACANGNDENGDMNDDNDYADLPVMTMEEVEENDGQEGRNAYVVVDGIVYDVTDVPEWSDGSHQGNQAGQDMTEQIQGSPHGDGVLDDLPAIGRIE